MIILGDCFQPLLEGHFGQVGAVLVLVFHLSLQLSLPAACCMRGMQAAARGPLWPGGHAVIGAPSMGAVFLGAASVLTAVIALRYAVRQAYWPLLEGHFGQVAGSSALRLYLHRKTELCWMPCTHLCLHPSCPHNALRA